MEKAYRRFAVGLLVALGILFLLCAAVVIRIDPFFHYRDVDPEGEVWFEERYQMAGLLRTQDYETVLMGTSLAANYRPEWLDTAFDTSAVKVTFPNGGLHEFDVALDYAYTRQDIKRLVFGLDPNILARDPAAAPDELPEYLYDNNPFNDARYLWSKSVLTRSVYVAMEKAKGNTEPLQEAFLWDSETMFFSRNTAIGSYPRPEESGTVAAEDAFLGYCEENLSVVESWIREHPETEFHLYLSPYSILFWDKMARQGETEAMFTMLYYAVEKLLPYENVSVHCFLTDTDIITNLDNYTDHIHVSGEITEFMVGAMAEGTYVLTEENYRTQLEALHDFVVNYDYESIFQ